MKAGGTAEAMILLTGGTGFLGRHLLPRLAAEGRRVRALSRARREGGGVEWVQGDLTDPASLPAAVEGVDTVVHAGAVLRAGASLESVNAGGTRALAEAARRAGVRRFVHVSSAGVYGDGAGPRPHLETEPTAALTPYERSKLAAERALVEALEGSAVQWTILRPQGLYGADRPATAELFREIARRRLWLHGPARVVVHPTHVLDLVAAIMAVVSRGGLHGEVINVGGERALEYPELIALIGARVGRAPLQLRAPGWLAPMARAAARALGSARPAVLDRLGREWINRSVDIGKARRELGFEPVPLEQELDRIAAQLRGPGP